LTIKKKKKKKKFFFKAVPQAPADAIFSILAKYNVDKYYNKTNLTVGAYRDDNVIIIK